MELGSIIALSMLGFCVGVSLLIGLVEFIRQAVQKREINELKAELIGRDKQLARYLHIIEDYEKRLSVADKKLESQKRTKRWKK